MKRKSSKTYNRVCLATGGAKLTIVCVWRLMARCLYGLGILFTFLFWESKKVLDNSIADNLELCQLINPLNIYCITKKFPKFHIRGCDAFILVFSPVAVSLSNFVFRFQCLNDQTFSPFKKKKYPILL